VFDSIQEAQVINLISFASSLHRDDGWDPEFVKPLLSAESVIRVGLRAREPLEKWVNGRIVMLGDAAHPPVPYIGQVCIHCIF
jgi:2-polyprenyl-6-methoxyphenol hydroxylase-like FAD-dependent oxidoreductase